MEQEYGINDIKNSIANVSWLKVHYNFILNDTNALKAVDYILNKLKAELPNVKDDTIKDAHLN